MRFGISVCAEHTWAVSDALIMFDCDGVLVDSERLEPAVIAQALSWLDLDADANEIHAKRAGAELALLLGDIETLHGQPLPDWFERRYRKQQFAGLQHVTPVPGAIEAVAAVAAEGLPMCVASGGPRVKMEITLGAVGLLDSFESHIFSCYETGTHKPDPGVYVHAMQSFATTPDRCIVVEDSVNGVRAGAGSGAFVIALQRDIAADELVDAGASALIGSMHDLPAAIAERCEQVG